MTKELVKRENGHKIVKHAMHDRSHSLLSGSRIKMIFASFWLVLLFLTAVSCEATSSTEDQPSAPLPQAERNTEDGQLKPSSTTDSTVFAINGLKDDAQNGKVKNDDSDLEKDKDVSLEELLLFESIINEDDEFSKKNFNYDKGVEKPDDSDANLETPTESKINTDFIDIRRQGEIKPENKQVESDAGVQFDDSKQESTADSPPRFGERSRKPKRKLQDGAPILQLTQGGYERPFKRPRFRSRPLSRPDSSEQSSRIQEPDRNSVNGRQAEMRQIIPQVTYTSSPQSQNAYGPGPILNSAFLAPGRNTLAMNHVVPPRSQSGLFSAPSAGLADYTNAAFQAQFPQNNEAAGFPDFGRNLNNAALYQTAQRNPFQDPGFLFQAAPQMQTQPVLIDPSRNAQPQMQPNPFATYPGFGNVNGDARLNYATYFRNPTLDAPLQVPQNFYRSIPNRANAFSNPPVTFISNYPQADARLSPQFFRHPILSEVPNNFQTSNDQQSDSDASQEKKTKIEEQEGGNPTNRNDSPSAPFGTRILGENEGDVYMRYPTNEAGYAIEENLPPQNNTDESKDSSQQTSSEQRNLSNVDPYRNALNSIRYNQKINNTYDFPPDLFRDPIDFGYHRRQPDIFIPFPDRNRATSRHPPPNIESRNPFDPVPSFPENNYQFLNADNQRYGHRESDEIPSCAKQKNVSVCFEDSEYPGNDILYSLNSNAFLADRLSGPDLQLTSVVLVEGNSSDSEQKSESYACDVDIRYGAPLRAKNLAGVWKVVVNLQGKLVQPVRMEVCKSLGDPCNYVDSKIKTTCVQKYNLQRFLTYSPGRSIHSDVFKIPVACSCQIVQASKEA